MNETEKNVLELIQGMITSGSGRSLAGQIRGAIDEIESAIKKDHSLKAIVEMLNANGIDVTYGYFKTALGRIRKERKRAKIREPTPGNSAVSIRAALPATEAPKPDRYTKNIRTQKELF